MSVTRGHQRAHLRAPFRAWILFGDGEYVHKAHSQNISEGGILLDQIPQYPQHEETPIMFALPLYPYFKDFDIPRLNSIQNILQPAEVLRGSCFLTRRTGETSSVDEVFSPAVGLRFTYMPERSKDIIAQYVEAFQGNLIYLQMLMDSWNSGDEVRVKARLIADLLGYEEYSKISLLRARVNSDYRSLQWL